MNVHGHWPKEARPWYPSDANKGQGASSLSPDWRERVCSSRAYNVTATLDTMADEDGQELEEPAAGENETRAGATSAWSDKVRRRFSTERLFRPGPSTATTSDPTRAAVNYLDPRERRIAVTATIFELALTMIVVVPYLTHKNKTSDLKTMGAVHVFLLEGIVLFIFLLLGTILKRRALFGFASLLVGFWLLQIKALSILGIAYVGLGMWLIFKGLKSPRAQARGAGRKPAAQPRERGSRKNEKMIAGRAAPKPNKRYTPPKPPRRAVAKKPAQAKAETPKG